MGKTFVHGNDEGNITGNAVVIVTIAFIILFSFSLYAHSLKAYSEKAKEKFLKYIEETNNKEQINREALKEYEIY